MKCISGKFGSNAVKELALHNDGEMQVLFYPAFRREKQLLKTMLKYLSDEDREEIQNQVDEFLDKTYKIPHDLMPTTVSSKSTNKMTHDPFINVETLVYSPDMFS